MDIQTLERRLQEAGYRIETVIMGDDGRMRWNINGHFMFQEDAVDLVNCVATIPEIVERNRGKIFPSR